MRAFDELAWLMGVLSSTHSASCLHELKSTTTAFQAPQATKPFKMNTLTRFVLVALVFAASLQDVTAAQPRSIAERRLEMRQRIQQAQSAKLAAFEQRERDFFSGKRRK